MQSDSDGITLHEGMIAAEFGVSRTPIRQVLQKLAYERLVETRSGVGTIVSPLSTESRDRDMVALRALFRAAGECAYGLKVSQKGLEKLISAQAVVRLASHDAEGYLQIRTELLDITADLAPDTILGDAMRAAHWRQVRWRMAEHGWTKDGIFEQLDQVFVACTEAAQQDGLAGLYAVLTEAEL